MLQPSVLIVDDTPLNRKLLQVRLEKEGYAVQGTASAEEAWDLLQTFRPSMILMDLELPKMTGLELTRIIRRSPVFQSTPVVALSAHSEGAYRQKALDAGCNEYLCKPVDTRLLLQVLRTYPTRRAPEGAQASSAQERYSLRLSQLRQQFLEEFRKECEALRAMPPGQFDAERFGKDVHRWIGCGTPAGLPALSVQARKIDDALNTTTPSEGEVRAYVDQLLAVVQQVA